MLLGGGASLLYCALMLQPSSRWFWWFSLRGARREGCVRPRRAHAERSSGLMRSLKFITPHSEARITGSAGFYWHDVRWQIAVYWNPFSPLPLRAPVSSRPVRMREHTHGQTRTAELQEITWSNCEGADVKRRGLFPTWLRKLSSEKS